MRGRLLTIERIRNDAVLNGDAYLASEIFV